ncbi:hypothetical protein [Ferrimonas pelagia]|uniref:Uncharacterized protein n=1 Tax=Ferrimonas pelagia TaxID=1177826 RepID=A0ABP9E994_9GAMM
MSFIFMALSAASVLPYQGSDSNDWHQYQRYQAFAHSDNNAIYDVLKTRKVPYQEGEFAFLQSSAELGVQKGNWAITAFARSDWHLDFSKDTMAFYGAIRNKEYIDPDRVYQLHLSANQLDAQGLKASYLWQLTPSFSLYGAAALLMANGLTHGEASGYAGRGADDNYYGEVELNYTYTKDYLFYRPLPPTQSQFGYSLDLGFAWQLSEQLTLSGLVEDLHNRIHWYDSPITQAFADTADTIVDPDGSVSVNPIIQGREYNGDLSQSMPVRARYMASYQRGNTHYQVRGQQLHSRHYTAVGFETQYPGLNWGAALYPQQGALALHLSNQYLRLQLMADHLDYQKVTTAELGFRFMVPL